jgi:hypothetical protein
MPEQKISSFELIAMLAMLAMMTGIVAFSIDGILPGMPVIANELSPQVSKKAQEVLVFFIFGMGLGTYLLVHFQMLLALADGNVPKPTGPLFGLHTNVLLWGIIFKPHANPSYF